MVTLAKYFHDSTGIDLTKTERRQQTADIDKALARQARSGRERQSVPTALEALYDVVVGVDRVQNCGFDRDSTVPERLNASQLNHVVDVAQKLKLKYSASAAQQHYLRSIETMAGSYRDMLSGELGGVSRRGGRHGTRHTLIRTENGTVYEMTNSMQETEIERFRRKTNMRLPAVEGATPNPASSAADVKGRKIVLGKGSFGIARVARNTSTGQWVAVKKTHPGFYDTPMGPKFRPALQSNFSLLPEAKKHLLRSISDAVILPSDEVKALSKAANGIPKQIGISQLSLEEIKEVKSVYTFSELGISTIDDVNKILNFAHIHFEGKNDRTELSVTAKTMLTDYAKLYGLIGPGYTTQEQFECGMAVFNHPSFPLKDPQRNQRFRNTLARHALRALSRLHGIGFTHIDIKPQNIVLSQSLNNIVTAKLIDIDMIRDQLRLRVFPGDGTRLYWPLEAVLPKSSNPSGYDAEKDDAYAMGVSLRSMSGCTIEDTVVAVQRQRGQAMLAILKSVYAAKPGRALTEAILEIESEIGQCSVTPSNCVRSTEEIGEATCVKDIADLLMQGPIEKRITPRQAINNLNFFKNEANFLSEEEGFSKDAKLIVRFCQFVPK